MDAEIKKVYLNWSEKGVSYMDIMYAYDTMLAVNDALLRCEKILGEAGLGIGYTSKQSEIDRLLEGKVTLRRYIGVLNDYVDYKLDQPLCKDFKKNATETISWIHLEDFEVDNTLGLTENNYIAGGMGYPGTMVEQEKGKLTFADFMGTSDGKAEGNGFYMAFTNGSVEDFASIFAGQYEAMLAAGITLSISRNKLLFKNADGIVIRETGLGEEQLKKMGVLLDETLDPKLEKYVKDSFEGVGKELQDNFNKYLRENVWCDETLSNAEKIAIMKANFSKLTAEQRANFNVIADARIVRNADYSNWGDWPDINWPDFPGLDPAKEVLGVSPENLKENLDRIGSLTGSNFGIMPEDGHIYTQSERSIAYIDNPEAYHQYTLDCENYFKCIDCIKDNDYKAMNQLIDELNVKNGTNIKHVSENIIEGYNQAYLEFRNNIKLQDLCDLQGIDSTYGVMGEAAAWIDSTGEVICVGGARQLNTPVSGEILVRLGILY